MNRRDVTFGYPVVLDLHGVPVLVVGAGPVAARKIAGLVAAGADVRVVAPEIDARLDRDGIADVRERVYEPSDLDGVRLVVTATGVEAVDAAVAADARSAGIWVNAADQPADCDFILPAIARQGPVSVAVSTDGKSPALAAHLRDRIASLLTPALATLADDLAAERSAIRAAGGSTEDRDWSARIDAALDRESKQVE
ncbi:MAG TPA: bifunctional precorrin-2 dehydrogenase/sirohydrochlorin ferrochelatase [Ilumatobacteraceae bacterium]|nr:bifunctional precorrin-2 dehydrogenase/sirohydrochlorin ferrochelatase [Ilumatobacteraceae bacterium]